MALRLWTGSSGSGKTRFLFEYVLKEAAEHSELNYIVIVPEQFTLSTQREFVRLSRDHGILNIDVLSFARLAHKIFEEVGYKDAGGKPIDDMGKNLILRHIAAKCEDRLSVFNGKMDKLGYITEVKSAISEFMQYGISADKVKEMAEAARNSGRGRLAAKLSDMEILYREFSKYTEDNYITKEERLDKARKAVYKSQKIRKSVVIFDGFTGFTPVQYNFIESLLQISRDIHVTILTDTRDNVTYNTNHELFYLGYKTANKLKKIAELNNIQVEKDFEILDTVPRRFWRRRGENNELQVTSKMLVHLEKNLFREYSKQYFERDNVTDDSNLPTKAVNTDIRVFSALQPIDEVRKVAVEIQKIIRNGNCAIAEDAMNGEQDYAGNNDNTCIRYKNIAVATGDLETYAPLFRRVFAEYRIPHFVDKTFPILMNPFIEYIRALLDVITDNCSYSAVFRYLRSPINDFKTSDIDTLENFVLRHGISGVSVWNSDWKEKYGRYYKKNNSSAENIVSEELVKVDLLRKKVIESLSDILDLITDGHRKRSKNSTKAVNEINAVFMRVFEERKIEDRIKILYEEYSKTDDFFKRDKEKEYEKIYGRVAELFERMSELLGDEKITMDEYGELLDAGFDEIRIGVIPTITDYIQIGDITRSRFDDIHTLFIVGANDGVIPKSSSSGGIISDIEKEFLIEYTPDIELAPTVREQAYTGQLYLYMLMTKPSNGLVVSYSRLSSDSSSLRPSYVIKVLMDMFPNIKLEKDFDDITDTIYNRNSLYNAIVENIRDKETEGLISLLLNRPEYGDLFRDNLLLAADASFMKGVLRGKDAISKSVASILYGSSIIGSVTKLEQYARCSFSYFLKYGLSLKEREVYSFEARDMGTVLHAIMEKYAKHLNENNLNWTDVDKAKSEEIVRNAIEECMNDPRYTILQSTSRHQYMVERIFRISLRSINVLTEHLRAGDFVPKDAEIMFSSANNLDALTFKLSDDEIMRLIGTIDRLDTYKDDEHIYIKVIDYKSGNKTFDLVEVYRGLSLQLVVYLNAATELVKKDEANAGLQVVPAGVLYYHIDDPLVDGLLNEDEAVIAERIKNELKMKGLVNSDESVYKHMDLGMQGSSNIIPVGKLKSGELSKLSSAASSDDFNTIQSYVNFILKDIGRNILDGNIKAEPHTSKGVDSNPCAYCLYSDICKYDNEVSEYEDGVTKENVIEKMREAVNAATETEEGGEADEQN